jgi:hypothetical protein
MTKDERHEIMRVLRNNEKVAIQGVEFRGAHLKAEFERQISAEYPVNHPAWAAATKAGEKAVAEANKIIATECKKLGVVETFAPRLVVQWGRAGRKHVQGETRRTAQGRRR